MFGEFVRSMRLKGGISLRQFCLALELDPSNWSKIERGLSTPPKGKTMLARIARALEIAPNSPEWVELHDLAALERGRLPDDILDDEKLVEKLPLFFRTLRGQKPTPAELRRLAELIRRS